MSDPVDPKTFLTLVELAIANMYEDWGTARTKRSVDQG